MVTLYRTLSGCAVDVVYCFLLLKEHRITSSLGHGSMFMFVLSCVDTSQWAWRLLNLQEQDSVLLFFKPFTFTALQLYFLQKMWVIQFHLLLSLVFSYTFPNYMLKNGEWRLNLCGSGWICGTPVMADIIQCKAAGNISLWRVATYLLDTECNADRII